MANTYVKEWYINKYPEGSYIAELYNAMGPSYIKTGGNTNTLGIYPNTAGKSLSNDAILGYDSGASTLNQGRFKNITNGTFVFNISDRIFKVFKKVGIVYWIPFENGILLKKAFSLLTYARNYCIIDA